VMRWQNGQVNLFGGSSGTVNLLIEGNLAVGTETPSANLHVVGNVYSTSNIEGALISATGQTLPLAPASEGVHMGLYSDIGAGIELISDSSTWGVIDFNKSPGATNYQQRIAGGNGDRLDFYTGTDSGGGIRMAIDSDGDVGIGTTSPSHKLEVSNGTISSRNILNSSNLHETLSLMYRDTGLHLTEGAEYTFDVGNIGTDGGRRLYIRYKGNDAAAKSNVMVIDGLNSTVGIGTTSPAYKLDVNGDAKISSTLYLEGGRIENNSGETTIASDGFLFRQRYSGGGPEVDPASMRILANGKVGIGTNNPIYNLDVNGDARLLGYLLVNSFTQGTEAVFSCDNGTFLSIECYSYGDVIKRPIALNANGGNVGIGATTPAEKLQVNGNILCNPSGYIGGRGSGTTAYASLNYNHLIHGTRCKILPSINVNGVNEIKNESVDLGDGSYWFNTTYTTDMRTAFASSGNYVIMNGEVVSDHPQIYPSSNGKGRIGLNTKRFYEVHTVSLYLNGSWVSSDDRLKHNEEEVVDALGTINKLKLYKYDKTDEMLDADFNGDLGDTPHHKEIGFIAQEVAEINELKFLVSGGGTAESVIEEEDLEAGTPEKTKTVDLPYHLDYNGITNMAVQAIQELSAQVELLKQEVANLKSQHISNDA